MSLDKISIILDCILILISLAEVITYKNLLSLMFVVFFIWTLVDDIKKYRGDK